MVRFLPGASRPYPAVLRASCAAAVLAALLVTQVTEAAWVSVVNLDTYQGGVPTEVDLAGVTISVGHNARIGVLIELMAGEDLATGMPNDNQMSTASIFFDGVGASHSVQLASTALRAVNDRGERWHTEAYSTGMINWVRRPDLYPRPFLEDYHLIAFDDAVAAPAGHEGGGNSYASPQARTFLLNEIEIEAASCGVRRFGLTFDGSFLTEFYSENSRGYTLVPDDSLGHGGDSNIQWEGGGFWIPRNAHAYSEPFWITVDAAESSCECTADSHCDDGVYCNGPERCSGGQCIAGALPCEAPLFSCDEQHRRCSCVSDEACDDGVWCTGTERCVAGTCEPGTEPCSDEGLACDEDAEGCKCRPDDSLTLLPTSNVEWGGYGGAVAIDGSTILIGAPGHAHEGVNCGVVYVYRHDGTAWNNEGTLAPSDARNGARFGAAVELHGDVAVVGASGGAQLCPDDPWCNAGSVYVFRRVTTPGPTGAQSWAPEAVLLAPDAARGDRFGGSVATDGNRILVGAPQADRACPEDPNCDSGAAYLFRFDGAGWVFETQLVWGGTQAADRFGTAVDIDGLQLIVAVPGDRTAYWRGGAAYVYRYHADQPSPWEREQKLIPYGAGTEAALAAVAIRSGTAVLGLENGMIGDGSSRRPGAAYVFTNSGPNWGIQAVLRPLKPTSSQRFGASLALSGDRILVGAPQAGGVSPGSGAAFLFRADPTSASGWETEAMLADAHLDQGDASGWSVAMSGSTAVVGARDAGGPQAHWGAATIFGGLSDCNLDGELDACEGQPVEASDCNGNGVPDGCDIAAGQSADGNLNGVPDECECDGDGECDDGRFCNGVESCVGHRCQSAGSPCQSQGLVCDEAGDECVSCVTSADCYDGLFCTGTESCVDGACASAGSPCAADTYCDEASDRCVECFTDGECDDGLYCNGPEHCTGGHCVPAAPPCGAVSCDEDSDGCLCLSDAECDDGLYCNGAEACVGGVCQLGASPCPSDFIGCDEPRDRCIQCYNEMQCDDGLFCNGNSVCVNYTCVADGDICAAYGLACDEADDACRCDGDDDCDDGLYCNGPETCDAGQCRSGGSPCLGAGLACNEASNGCYACVADGQCDDGVHCNGAERCAAGFCSAGVNPCPGLLCDEAGNACAECLTSSDCSDGLFCTGVDRCISGGCFTDPVPCPAAYCDEGGDRCLECIADAECDDGEYCNGPERCAAGACEPGTGPCGVDPCSEFLDACVECIRPQDCDDAEPCTIESCDLTTGSCVYTPRAGCGLRDDESEGDGGNEDGGEGTEPIPPAEEAADGDADGVGDDLDGCPGTLVGEVVDVIGCACRQRDDDGDGVDNCLDACPATAAGSIVSAAGCAGFEVVSETPDEADAATPRPSASPVPMIACGASGAMILPAVLAILGLCRIGGLRRRS